jgi:hypothetical protein
MTATVQQATDDVYGTISLAMRALFPAVVRKYDGIDDHKPPAMDKSWIFAVLRHATGRQGSLAGDTGKRRWTAVGTLIVQVFVPMEKTGRTGAVNIASALKSVVQKTQTENGVWFRNVTINEIGEDKGWYQVNMSATFTYDTFE